MLSVNNTAYKPKVAFSAQNLNSKKYGRLAAKQLAKARELVSDDFKRKAVLKANGFVNRGRDATLLQKLARIRTEGWRSELT